MSSAQSISPANLYGSLPQGWGYAFVQMKNGDRGKWEAIEVGAHFSRYRLDSPNAIRIKCLAIVAVLPVYTAARIVFLAIQGPLLSLKTVLRRWAAIY